MITPAQTISSTAPAAIQILEAMEKPLSLWLGQTEFNNWLAQVDNLPSCSALFLEISTNSLRPGCDVITSVRASDGTLTELLINPITETSAAWQKTGAMLTRWQQQLQGQSGYLRTHCFSMWLEFDIQQQQHKAGDPAVFIALTPQARITELAGDLIDYPDLQYALQRSKSLLEKVAGTDTLVLGHIGYMASRQKEENKILPLRSCWRCNDLSHFYQLLELAAIPFELSVVNKELQWLENLSVYVNSMMLDLDSDTAFLSDFSLELNVYKPYAPPAAERENELFRIIADAGFMKIAQQQKLLHFSNTYYLKNDQGFISSLHHIKLKFSNSKIQEVKCYWQASAKPRSW
ncbi:hypothetical protein TH53_18130 [Pedobacter lusitanus]|uniref:Uncharacterized protein n=1 Tax=Pedobacter lusitanus TaxID=1503925 RepID=A0A0D0FTQ8_9SPHI|nr:hypothetical protein [Pedobacter lusitanus]KIO75819.1 hypothetical protein TH53_18130 [Pedobacter lusitanus]